MAWLVGCAAAEVHAATETQLYEVYTKDVDGSGVLNILVRSPDTTTGRKLVLMLGGEIKTPITINEYRHVIRIDSRNESGEQVSMVHPSYIDFEDGWQNGGLKVVYGEITGDQWQDMLIVGGDGGNSYTLSGEEQNDQLVVQQVLDDEKLKFYTSQGYELRLEDMNADAMDDLVISKDGTIVDIIVVSAQGTFFARDTSAEASRATADIAVHALLDAADRGDVTGVMQLMGREVGHHLQQARDVLGDEAFLDVLAEVEYAVPGRVGVNFAQYEMAVRAEDGTLEFFPLTMERSRNGLWKIEGL